MRSVAKILIASLVGIGMVLIFSIFGYFVLFFCFFFVFFFLFRLISLLKLVRSCPQVPSRNLPLWRFFMRNMIPKNLIKQKIFIAFLKLLWKRIQTLRISFQKPKKTWILYESYLFSKKFPLRLSLVYSFLFFWYLEFSVSDLGLELWTPWAWSSVWTSIKFNLDSSTCSSCLYSSFCDDGRGCRKVPSFFSLPLSFFFFLLHLSFPTEFWFKIFPLWTEQQRRWFDCEAIGYSQV